MTKTITHCPECQSPLVNGVNGSICMSCGKSGVFPKLDSETNKAAVRRIRLANLPVARQLQSIKAAAVSDAEGVVKCRDVFTIAGKAGLWHRVARTTTTTDPGHAKLNGILAFDVANVRAVELQPFAEANAEVFPAKEEPAPAAETEPAE